MIKKSLKFKNQTWVHYNGRTFVVDENRSSSRKQTGGNVSSGIIDSPMPGKVLHLNCKVGDQVEEHQTLCIIEAMKMEYSLKAPFAGKVKEILKSPGQQISLGDKILEITK